MKHDLLRIIKGELWVEASGPHTERLLNLALQQGIDLRGLSRSVDGSLRFRIPLTDIYRLRHLARDARCRIRLLQRRGLPFFLAFLRRRPLLPLTAALGVLLLSFFFSLVFSLEVTSPYDLSQEDKDNVLAIAKEAGIQENKSRWTMDLEAAEEAILDQFPQIFYAEIYEHGIRLEIRVVKRTDVPEEEQQLAAGNLVAACPGVIQDVLVRWGTAAVQSGDTVDTGDVLIYGWFAGKAAAADGIVTAKIYGEGYGECAEEQTRSRKTGKSAQSVAFRFADGRAITLVGKTDPGYANASVETEIESLSIWRNISLPVELIYIHVYELISYTVHYTPEQAEALAEASAKERAEAGLGDGAVTALSGAKITTESIYLEDGVRRVRAVAEALAEIGRYEPLSAADQAELEQRAEEEKARSAQETP